MEYSPAAFTVNEGFAETCSITKFEPLVNTKMEEYPVGMLMLPSGVAEIVAEPLARTTGS